MTSVKFVLGVTIMLVTAALLLPRQAYDAASISVSESCMAPAMTGFDPPLPAGPSRASYLETVGLLMSDAELPRFDIPEEPDHCIAAN